MMNRIAVHIILLMVLSGGTAFAQTAKSLFWRSDSLQVAEIISDDSDLSDKIGHGGPAVENSHMALRLLLDESGAVDVYTKTGRGMELLEYFWAPTDAQIDTLYAGYDAYEVGGTLGLGGVALWDGTDVVRLEATEGWTLRTGSSKKGSYAEVIYHGVPYMGDKLNVSVRIDMFEKSRTAGVCASEVSGKKVQFVTGINWHQGQKVTCGDGYVSVWGRHPVDVHGGNVPVGAGIIYSDKMFPVVKQTDDMVLLISRPSDEVRTEVVASSTREVELNSAKRFESFMNK